MAGSVSGRLDNDIMTFKWNWKYSSEKGGGIFWTGIPNVLYGGWWMDFEDVDVNDIIGLKIPVPNRWEFASINNLEVTLGTE